MKGASLAKADEEEANSLRRYSQLRRRGNRPEFVANQEFVAGTVLGVLLCSLQVAILLRSNGWAQPVVASATLVFCFGISLRLLLTAAAQPPVWRRPQRTDAELFENKGH